MKSIVGTAVAFYSCFFCLVDEQLARHQNEYFFIIYLSCFGQV